MGGKDLKFSFVKIKTLAEIHNLANESTCQENYIPVKIKKGDVDIFSDFFSITSII